MLKNQMKIDVLRGKERGFTETPWLQSRHSFSFGSYYNPDRLNFGTLCVFNEDSVQPGKGFAAHTHENMEIVTIVLSGTLAHKDSTGHEAILNPYDVQRISAGSGIQHSEMNPSDKEPVHFLQIWVHPQQRDLAPSYEQKHFDLKLFENTLYPLVISNPEQAALTLHQEAAFYLGYLSAGHSVSHTIRRKNRGLYVFVIEGSVQLDSHVLKAKDSAQITQADEITLEALTSSRVLVVEVGVSTL